MNWKLTAFASCLPAGWFVLSSVLGESVLVCTGEAASSKVSMDVRAIAGLGAGPEHGVSLALSRLCPAQPWP